MTPEQKFVERATAILEMNAQGVTVPRIPNLAVELLQEAVRLLSNDKDGKV